MPTTTPIGLNLNTMCQIMFDNVALSRYWTFSGGYGGGGGGNFNPGTCTCNTGRTKCRSRMHIFVFVHCNDLHNITFLNGFYAVSCKSIV